jgi:hypothetical protein
MGYLAKPLTLQLEHCIPPDTVYLRWLSGLGTWECWAWAAGEVKTGLTDSTQSSTADGRSAVAVRRASADTMTIQADNLSVAQWDALVSILSSPQVYRQFASGARQPVLVAADASAVRLSSDTKTELEITISLPARNALTH